MVTRPTETPFDKNRELNDCENEIFPILNSARARTSLILAGKRGSRRRSTTSFRENVVLAKTSYHMLEIVSISDREKTFVVKKVGTMKLSGVSIFRK